MFRILSVLCIVSLFGCKEKSPNGATVAGKSTSTETIEIYRAIQDGQGYKYDSLLYVEMNFFDQNQKTETHFLNPDKSLKGKEMYQFKDRDTVPFRSDYLDKDGKLMSYYSFIYDKKNRKISSAAFDGNTDDALRFERYKYDKNGHLSEKTIVDGEFDPSRKFVFINDLYGNVTTMYILNESNDTIGTEVYKIMQYTADKKWTEKWGFINDIPKTYYKRTFE